MCACYVTLSLRSHFKPGYKCKHFTKVLPELPVINSFGWDLGQTHLSPYFAEDSTIERCHHTEHS